MAAAARNLFAADGYVATTIAAIVEAADIPAPTIYSAFGAKAKILRAIAWGVTATLDVDASHEEAIARPDPAQGLRLAAHLAPGVSGGGGGDIYVALVLPEIYRTLVLERRWTVDQYETWLADTLIHQLLPHS
ncbi:hypothetical protein BBK14_16615 [Parafrankia soli]|uniref:HTH tetR-type domain-containing protein n=1 Tax=Parafrankia soli TaxID=2599596 RepID=A0A1S1QA04_9ACTN|nr:hypothetical protein BBK14_16615 [Parafrankia soli]